MDVLTSQFYLIVTFGPSTVQSLRGTFPPPHFLDCHLSCQNPEFYIENSLGESASQISFHPEAVETFTERKKMCEKIKFPIQQTRLMSINPSTELEDTSVFELLRVELVRLRERIGCPAWIWRSNTPTGRAPKKSSG